VIYLTRGERGIADKSPNEAAAIRTAESEAACRVIGAAAVFAGQVDGETEVNRQRIAAFSELLEAQTPDVVITHWPIDTHGDHQVASVLTQRAYLSAARPFRLYFFEVEYNAPGKLDRGISYKAVSEPRRKTRSWRHSATTTVPSSKPRWRSKR
jgi:LmbE family N-acetylglucosaminyl deacetylase